MFMHGSLQHIFFNMFAFWMFGYALENVWGSKRFLIFFLVTGLGAAMIQMLVFYFTISPDLVAIDAFKSDPSVSKFYSLFGTEEAVRSGIDSLQGHSSYLSHYGHELLNKIPYLNSQAIKLPEFADSLHAQANALNMQGNLFIHQSDSLNTASLARAIDYTSRFRADYLNMPLVVGASGAVFGILLAFGMLFPNSRIYIYFFIPMKAKWFVIIYGVIELVAGFGNFKGDNVAHFAHLGGMLFGFILIMIWRKQAKNKMFR
jgi:membrane associated rhomboid family serine protease